MRCTSCLLDWTLASETYVEVSRGTKSAEVSLSSFSPHSLSSSLPFRPLPFQLLFTSTAQHRLPHPLNMPLLLLTGGSGFAASSIALQALRRGFSVRLALRKQSQADLWRSKHGEEWANKLQYAIVPDFTTPGAFDQAVEQCDYVIHTAQAFNWDPKVSLS